jgi:hypothetical protein
MSQEIEKRVEELSNRVYEDYFSTAPKYRTGQLMTDLVAKALREDANREPFRIDKDGYVPNYGEVEAGDWLHYVDGGHAYCGASAILEVSDEG